MKTSRIHQSISLLACTCLAGAAFGQETTPRQADITTQTQLGRGQAQIGAQTSIQSPSSVVLKLGQVEIKDNAGQQLGTVENVVVSPQGCIDMALLSVGGGTKLVPVPWQMVRTEQSSGIAGAAPVFMVSVDRTRLLQAPSIERAQIDTQIRQPGFSQQVSTFYGVQAGGASTDTTLGGVGGRLGGIGRTNVFPTGRTNIFRGSGAGFGRTNDFRQPGTGIGTPTPGQLPPGTVPTPPAPGTPPNLPGSPNNPGSLPNSPNSPNTPGTPPSTP